MMWKNVNRVKRPTELYDISTLPHTLFTTSKEEFRKFKLEKIAGIQFGGWPKTAKFGVTKKLRFVGLEIHTFELMMDLSGFKPF